MSTPPAAPGTEAPETAGTPEAAEAAGPVGGSVPAQGSAVGASATGGSAAGRFARRHVVFLIVAGLGLVLRVLVVAAYRPALEYLGDSGAYLDQAWNRLYPGDWRPSGYPMMLRLVAGQAHLTRLVVLQHLLTFAAGVGLYAVTLRLGRRPGLAALVAAPALLSPWVADLGQFVLADSLFGTLVLAGLLPIALPGRPGLWSCVASGALLGAAVTVRSVGYGPLAVATVVLLVAARTVGVRRIAAFAVAAAVPLLGYSAWSAGNGGPFTVSGHSGFFLYGRVAPFADCAKITRADLRTLCDPRPVAERPQPDAFLWPAASPLRQGDQRIPPGREQLAGEFASKVIRAQPGMLASTTAGYLAGYFSPVRHETSKTSRAATWELPDRFTNALPASDPHSYDGYYVTTYLNRALARPLNAYARGTYAPMPLVGLGLLAGLAAAARAGWARRRPAGQPEQPDRPGGPPRLFWLAGGAALSVLAVGALTAGFDYRYLGSVIGPLGAAAVLGLAALIRPARTGSAG